MQPKDLDLATRSEWKQTESLTLLRKVMGLDAGVRARIATATGLSNIEMHALEHLSRGSIGPAEIARLLDVSTAAATGIVNRLETKGHVERRPHSRDRRRTEIVLTDFARGEVLSHLGEILQGLAALDASLTQDERTTVVRYLRGAVASVTA